MSKYTEDMTDYIVHKYIDDKGFIVGYKNIGILDTDSIPVSWLTSTGMQLVSNDVRPELFKLIRAYHKEKEQENE